MRSFFCNISVSCNVLVFSFQSISPSTHDSLIRSLGDPCSSTSKVQIPCRQFRFLANPIHRFGFSLENLFFPKVFRKSDDNKNNDDKKRLQTKKVEKGGEIKIAGKASDNKIAQPPPPGKNAGSRSRKEKYNGNITDSRNEIKSY
jgi:hypothetical protein